MIDSQEPVITCPSDVTVKADALTSDAIVMFHPAHVYDNVDNHLLGLQQTVQVFNGVAGPLQVVTQSGIRTVLNLDSDTGESETFSIVYRVTDSNNLVDQCTQLIHVIDVEKPMVYSCPKPVDVYVDAGSDCWSVDVNAVCNPFSVGDNCMSGTSCSLTTSVAYAIDGVDYVFSCDDGVTASQVCIPLSSSGGSNNVCLT